jgi:hypothetical protein
VDLVQADQATARAAERVAELLPGGGAGSVVERRRPERPAPRREQVRCDAPQRRADERRSGSGVDPGETSVRLRSLERVGLEQVK